MTEGESDMAGKFFEWLNRRFVRATVAVLVAAVLFTGVSVSLGSGLS